MGTDVQQELVAQLRLRIDHRYDGTAFHGWAQQPGLRTVEGELQAGLEMVLRQPISLTVAGRTDAGVHAWAQVAHVDVDPATFARGGRARPQEVERLAHRLNGILSSRYVAHLRPIFDRGLLPKAAAYRGESDLQVQSVTVVDPSFDARFSALQRRYRYVIADRLTDQNPLLRSEQWFTSVGELDQRAMEQAAVHLVGEHDFLSFCRPREGATTIRTLKELTVVRGPSGVIEVDVVADAFCHSMVRSLVGGLVEVGRGKRDTAWTKELVTTPSRSHGVPVAPARGLTLMEVTYPEEGEWGTRARKARARRDCI